MVLALCTGAVGANAAEVSCSPFKDLDISRLPTKLNPSGTDRDRLADVWKRWSKARLSTPATGRRMIIERHSSPSQPSYEVRGRRSQTGWRVEARSAAPLVRTIKWSRWRRVQLTNPQQAELDNLWNDRCLWTAPPLLANTLPLKSGGWVPSFDGPITLFDLRDEGRRWGGLYLSWQLGKPAKLASVLWNAAFGLPRYEDHSVQNSGVIYGDEAGTRSFKPLKHY